MADEGANERRSVCLPLPLPLPLPLRSHLENDHRLRRNVLFVVGRREGVAPRDSTAAAAAVASESVSDPLQCGRVKLVVAPRMRQGRKGERKKGEGREEGRKGGRGPAANGWTDGRTDGRTEAIRWRSGRQRCLVAIEILRSCVRVACMRARPLQGRNESYI